MHLEINVLKFKCYIIILLGKYNRKIFNVTLILIHTKIYIVLYIFLYNILQSKLDLIVFESWLYYNIKKQIYIKRPTLSHYSE